MSVGVIARDTEEHTKCVSMAKYKAENLPARCCLLRSGGLTRDLGFEVLVRETCEEIYTVDRRR